jgi:hypothetical protein
VDASASVIARARQREKQERFGIVYHVADAMRLEPVSNRQIRPRGLLRGAAGYPGCSRDNPGGCPYFAAHSASRGAVLSPVL